jgi:hypothetical protein
VRLIRRRQLKSAAAQQIGMRQNAAKGLLFLHCPVAEPEISANTILAEP